MTPEGIIQKEIIDYIKLIGGIVFRMNSGQTRYNVKLAEAGTPDLLCILKDKTLWIEVKTATGQVNDAQRKMHCRLIAYNQTVIVARSLDDVIKKIML